MMLREWEAAMTATGAVRIHVSSVRRGEYKAEAVVGKGLIAVEGESLESVCERLLERCRK